MDHRISKDMISSGMIPSGEKNQEDLSRTQYGTAPSPNALSDVYKSMYEKKEETLNEHHKKDADGNTIPHEHEEELDEGKIPAGLQSYLDKKKGKKEDKKEMKEGMGLYANIHKKRKSGRKMRKKGAKGAPSSQDFANAAKTAKEEVEIDEAIQFAPMLAKVAKIATRTGIKLGGKTGGKMVQSAIKKPLRTAADVSLASNLMPKPSGIEKKPSTAGTVSADTDLFDIVKGQLLDEGLSEEEIKDIMLSLTPDEIMEELSDVVKRNDALNKERAMKAAQERKVPDNVKAASKRQYTAGGPKDKGENKYTTQDKKTIIDYNKNKESM